MKRATAVLQQRNPDIQIEGEMYAFTAFNEWLRESIYAESKLHGSANVLVMPNMDAASISLGLIRSLTSARLVGPSLVGLRKGCHILIPSVSPRGIFNMSALTAADIQVRRGDAAKTGA